MVQTVTLFFITKSIKLLNHKRVGKEHVQSIMKTLRKSALLLVAMFVALFATSCGGDDDDEPEVPQTLEEKVLGSWVEINLDDDEPPFYLTLSAGQTGTLSFTSESRATFTQRFSWEVGTGSNGLNFISILTTGGDKILDDGHYTLTIIGDNLEFGGLRFRRN